MYYELGNSIFSQNRSTCPNTYNELGYFELITGETCQHECEKLINCIKENKLNSAQNHSCIVLTVKNILYSCGMHQSCQSLWTHHRTRQHSLKKGKNMVIIPTYCEIKCALIISKQMARIIHKQHQPNSPTNMTPIRNN